MAGWPRSVATKHPKLVRTLTLSEPPVLRWVEEQTSGDTLVQDFFQRFWIPLGRACARHDRVKALAIAAKYFTGNSVLPAAFRAALEPNLQEWEVLTVSGHLSRCRRRDRLKRSTFRCCYSLRIIRCLCSSGASPL